MNSAGASVCFCNSSLRGNKGAHQARRRNSRSLEIGLLMYGPCQTMPAIVLQSEICPYCSKGSLLPSSSARLKNEILAV